MNSYLEGLVESYPVLEESKKDILQTVEVITTSFKNNGKLLLMGNGGSSADCDHIVGELMKGFLKKRKPKNNDFPFWDKIPTNLQEYLLKLQSGLPAINLSNNPALISAISNDISGDLIFSQQVFNLAKKEDIVFGISTSGNAYNIKLAFSCAKALGIKTILLTGKNKNNKISNFADICINVPEQKTYKVQELHLPVYHCICSMLEDYFWKE